MPDVTPYLNIDDFVSMFRPLTSGERRLATKLLAAASDWIRRNAPTTVSATDAELVVLEVVKAAMPVTAGNGQNMSGRTQYLLQTDDRMESATIAEAAGLLDFTDHLKTLLGISIATMPAFGGFDSGFGGYV